ncbi:uncharacterized protein LOC131299474 isoform X1 [Rhododendron vialii]|uniref:uncharacterized protein LOC131299474 isoform X1 n=1 Tax=Rhododendron vialii TaxID=182163 RepID=UPI00265E4250|nr:uncharacterized protein LOC131299474 isoform X1 [Rhododendron vialii]
MRLEELKFNNALLEHCLRKMFIQLGYLNKEMTGIEKDRQERIKQNLREIEAAGLDITAMKAMTMSLYGPKQKANGKTTKEGKNKVGHGTTDEEFLPPEGEENLSVYSDDDESSRSQAKKAKVMGPGKKRGTSTTQVLRKSQRTQVLRKSQRNQEEGGSSNGATSTLPRQPLADNGQVMSMVAANDQHASVPTTSNCLGMSKRKRGLSQGITVQKIV